MNTKVQLDIFNFFIAFYSCSWSKIYSNIH